jgi:predicted metal-dependent phosphoesterase TrpH
MSGGRQEFAVDFHVHTAFSFDSVTPPRTVIEMARRRGLDAIAVTDHDTIEGALATIEANRYADFHVIPGIEVKSDIGDVIALYVTQNIESRNFADIVEEIHALGGIVYLPHALRTFRSREIPGVRARYPAIDLWELYNGRYTSGQYARVESLFAELGVVGTLCGSDAHFPWEVGAFRTLFTRVPYDAATLLEISAAGRPHAPSRGDLAPKVGMMLGEVTKSLKKREFGKLAQLLGSLPRSALNYGLRQRGNRKIGTPIVPAQPRK